MAGENKQETKAETRKAKYLRDDHAAKGVIFDVTESPNGTVVARSEKHTWEGSKAAFKQEFDPA